jgi:hypothetical protein
MNEATRMRTALLFTLSGLIVEAFCLQDLTPGTFLVFALVSVPLVGVGLLLFGLTVWRVLRETKGL